MTALAITADYHSAGGFSLDLDCSLPLTGVTALFGPSGSGKTTLLHCIAGLRPDSPGVTVRFADEVWQSATQFRPAWERGVGYVFQDARLFPQLSVTGNLAYAAKRAKPGGFRGEQVSTWLQLDGLLERAPESLSAGQQQRVAIARALMSNPRLLLLDEPLVNLDRAAARECLACLTRVSRDTGLPMVYVSHQIEEVSAIADQLLLINNGRILAQGPLLELAGRLDNPLADDEAAAALLTVTVGGRDTRYHLTELCVGSCPDSAASIWVSANAAPGTRKRLRVPARDVSVCRSPPRDSSILNILPVTLSELRDVGESHCMLRLQLTHEYLLARITRRSRDELNLKPGDALHAQIKSTALLGEDLSA